LKYESINFDKIITILSKHSKRRIQTGSNLPDEEEDILNHQYTPNAEYLLAWVNKLKSEKKNIKKREIKLRRITRMAKGFDPNVGPAIGLSL